MPSNLLSKILVTADGSDCASSAVDLLLRLGLKNAEARVVTVTEYRVHNRASDQSLDDQINAKAQSILDAVVQRLTSAGFNATGTICQGHAADQILEEAESYNPDLIVAGTRGHSLIKRFLLGSVSQRIVKYAKCSVLLCRSAKSKSDDKGLRIVMGYDGSPPANKGLEILNHLALGEQGHIHLLTAMTLLPYYGMDMVQESSPQWLAEKAASKDALTQAQAQLTEKCPHVSSELLQSTEASEAISKAATEHQADMIVVGATGASGISRFLLGSVCDKVVQHAQCSVLVIR